MWKMLPGIAVAVLLLGAGCGASTQQLRGRASSDLRCPPDRLQMVQIDSSSREVRGCGQRAVYLEHCGQQGCGWVLRSKHSN
jgi:hypothetical protein